MPGMMARYCSLAGLSEVFFPNRPPVDSAAWKSALISAEGP